MIIDAHSHLGDILNRGGGELIYRKGVRMPAMMDPQALSESLMMRNLGLGKLLYYACMTQATRAERARNSTATLENMRESLDGTDIAHTVCLPIAPHVTFKDLIGAAAHDDRIVPFTTVDFDDMSSMEESLREDVRDGARGLKLHPVIQRVSPTDERTSRVLEAFQPLGRPVLVHAGKSQYYLGDEKHRNVAAFGSIKPIAHMVRNFPGIRFVVGHAGLFWHREVRALMGGLKNVWVDTSFQSPYTIRKLIRSFGAERVMYASDWPYGNRKPHLRTVRAACRGDASLERMIFFENAASLLGISASRV